MLLFVAFDQVGEHIQIVLLAGAKSPAVEEGVHHLGGSIEFRLGANAPQRELFDEREI